MSLERFTMANKMPKSKKEFNKYVDENLDKWADEFTSMLLSRVNWDLTFDEFIRYNLWKTECKDEIDVAFEDFQEEFPQEKNVTREHIAHDLFLMAKERFLRDFENMQAQA